VSANIIFNPRAVSIVPVERPANMLGVLHFLRKIIPQKISGSMHIF